MPEKRIDPVVSLCTPGKGVLYSLLVLVRSMSAYLLLLSSSSPRAIPNVQYQVLLPGAYSVADMCRVLLRLPNNSAFLYR